MARASLFVRGPLGVRGTPKQYLLASRVVVSDWPGFAPGALELAAEAVADTVAVAPPEPLSRDPSPPLACRSSRGLLAGRELVVDCRIDIAGTHRLKIGDLGRFAVAADGSAVDCQWLAHGLSTQEVREVVAGPPIVTALALQGCFCLHASALAGGRRAVAFLGESGAGKSTLAARLAGAGVGERLADDVLPVALRRRRARILPHFPQLKLAESEQWPRQAARSLDLRAALIVEPVAPEARAAVELVPLGPADAALALLRHTVAARLFGPGLMQRHLEFCAALAEQAPVLRLVYPHAESSPDAVARALRAGGFLP